MSAILLSGKAAAWPKRPPDPSNEAESAPIHSNREWEIDRALMLERSERRAWRVAVAGLILGLIGIAAVFVQVPLRRVGLPLVDRHQLYRQTSIGYEGAMQVVTTLVNAVLEKLDADTMGMATTDYNFDLVR